MKEPAFPLRRSTVCSLNPNMLCLATNTSLPLLVRGQRLTVLLVHPGCQGHWNNDWDGLLNFRCPEDSWAVTSILSVHDNHREDRRFAIGCTRVSHCTRRHTSCYWTKWVNSYDHLIHFTCKSNHYINGMKSHHSNRHEDRIWKFRCCAISGSPLEDCVLSGWTNGWDARQHFVAKPGQVLKGVVSVHNNHREDRVYEYLVCKLGGREEGRATTLLDYLMQKPLKESQEEPREMTLNDYPRQDSQEELKDVSEDESRKTTLLHRPEQDSSEDSQGESQDDSSASKDESYEE